jgi:hypothetical protein
MWCAKAQGCKQPAKWVKTHRAIEIRYCFLNFITGTIWNKTKSPWPPSLPVIDDSSPQDAPLLIEQICKSCVINIPRKVTHIDPVVPTTGPSWGLLPESSRLLPESSRLLPESSRLLSESSWWGLVPGWWWPWIHLQGSPIKYLFLETRSVNYTKHITPDPSIEIIQLGRATKARVTKNFAYDSKLYCKTN